MLRDRRALFDEFPKEGLVVEVGAQKGVSASLIHKVASPRLLVLVDVWRFIPGEYERDPANRPTETREKEMKECARRVGHLPNVAMLRCFSHEAVEMFADGVLDAVYLDADHTRAGITADLERWWPKVRPGGVLAGHDYTKKLPWADVIPVVNAWVEREGLHLTTTTECEPRQASREDVDGCVFASWMVTKP